MSKQIEASSELNVDQCTFTWTISDYSSIVKVPGGYDESCKEFISLFLSRIKHDEMKEVSECKLTISILTPVCGLSIQTREFSDISLFINAEELKNIDDSIIFINLIQSMIKSK
ncbi:hypothetical protein TKK_0008502 [Trichogramma kaykai]